MLYQIAENYFSLDQPEEARLYCDKALKNDPENYWLLDLSARIYEKVHDGDKAIRVREQLYTIKPTQAEKLLRLYYIYKHNDKGKKLLQETQDKGIYVINHKFYENKFLSPTKQTSGQQSPPNKEEAERPSDKTTKTSDTYKRILSDLIDSYQNKDYQNLLDISSDALALYPAQVEIYYYYGLALNGLQQYHKAMTILEEGLDFLPDDKDFNNAYFSALVLACNKSGNTSKAAKYKKMSSP
jgi:tetratricopeptide (TPR) repeat protein